MRRPRRRRPRKRHGERFGWPGGRPEEGESWHDTLRREIREEVCAIVTVARLLGFTRSVCVDGHECGLVLVRAIWRADVELLPWAPQHEISHREVVREADLHLRLWMEDGLEPIYRRALSEAALT